MQKYIPVLQYINVPNLITTLGMAFGIAACYFVTQENLKFAMLGIFLAAGMDLLDGFFANKLNQETRFGQYVDSLVDFFVCCIIPMFIVLTFFEAGIFVFTAIIFYCACGLWRLAHFDVLLAEKRSHFTGMPVPGGMGFAIFAIWLTVRLGMPVWACLIIIIAAGCMMISYVQLKKYGLWQKILGICGVLFFIFAMVLPANQ
jgi:CDP-diacylglycerol--serine O-phosphatidyltransferase